MSNTNTLPLTGDHTEYGIEYDVKPLGSVKIHSRRDKKGLPPTVPARDLGASRYCEDYVKNELSLRESFKPLHKVIESRPMCGVLTTYATTFLQHVNKCCALLQTKSVLLYLGSQDLSEDAAQTWTERLPKRRPVFRRNNKSR